MNVPDDVMVLGVDRAELQPVGPIDAAIDIGGPAYPSTLISDTRRFAAFFGEVLGFELRREFTFQSEGPSGGMRLPAGTDVHFQQGFAPGRGIAMWSFPTADLAATVHREGAVPSALSYLPMAPNTLFLGNHHEQAIKRMPSAMVSRA